MQFSTFKLPKLPNLSFPAPSDDDGSTGTSLLHGDSQAGKSAISLPKMFSSTPSTPSPQSGKNASPFNILTGSSKASSSSASPARAASGFALLSGTGGPSPSTSMKDKMKNAAMSAAEDHGMDPNAAEAAMTFNSPPPFPCCVGMSKKDRIMGFMICFAIGSFCNVLALSSWSSILLGRPAKFAFLYSCGNVCCFGATFFLIGPKRQFKTMTKKSRRVSVAIYLSIILLTLICVFVPWRSSGYGMMGGLIITMLVFTQIAAGFWYTLSYIPYGRAAAVKVLFKAKAKGEKMMGS
mmetsp:Transcript_2020/g.4095  ORF Transcript_2020/g.4095 Transcript_2020/m.4095 type:complete len:294 (-) Transcript_2020:9-890(-)